MKITLKDGSCKEYAAAMSVYDIALDISEGLARVACAGEVNGKVVDLRTMIDADCELNILTANDEQGLRTIRHTCSHVLAEAVKRVFPDAKLAIGPSIDEGFYYDFEHAPFSREDLDKLEAEMKKIIKEEGISFAILTVDPEEAKPMTDLLLECGIRGIVNYTPCVLTVTKDVKVENVSLLTALSTLAIQ